jgi:hypothetical protein
MMLKTSTYAARTPNPTEAITVRKRIRGIINEITIEILLSAESAQLLKIRRWRLVVGRQSSAKTSGGSLARTARNEPANKVFRYAGPVFKSNVR